MELKQSQDDISLHTFHYALRFTSEDFNLVDPRLEVPLIDCPSPVIYWPEFDGQALAWEFDRFQVSNSSCGPVEIKVLCKPDNDVAGPLTIALKCFEEYFEFSASCSVRRECTLARWNFFQPGTGITAYRAHHFRNRHGDANPYETYNLMRGAAELAPPRRDFSETPPEMVRQWVEDAEFTTFSTDWQFAPHPSFVLFQKDSVMMCLGARDLPQSFGMEVRIGCNTLKRWCLNHGGEHGHPLAAGQDVLVSRMYMWLDHHGDIWSSVDHYVNLLLEDGMIARRSLLETPHWWRKPLYCTWLDQGFVAEHTYSHLHKTDGWTGKKGASGPNRYTALTAEMVTTVLETIARQKLPLGGIILDASWFVTQGQWEADRTRFPDMRQTIEDIHAAGLKAVLWMSPLMIDAKAEVATHPEYLLNKGQTLERYPHPAVDFSDPKVQEEYLKPTMRYMFSSDADCLNADGLKLDYTAYKVFPEYQVHDLSWRGEEMFVRKTIKLIYDEMKRHKPDGCMIGVALHPYFVDCQDMVRTYDVPGSQLQHRERARMIRHFCPGNLVSFDLVDQRCNWDEYFRLAQQSNALVQVGNILGIEGSPLGAADYEFLRSRLRRWC